jgi:hypothetical protein
MKDWDAKDWLSFLAVVAIGVILFLAVIKSASAQEQPAPAVFDHSACQYPDRETNPPNGCDNSDPACPETIKFGYDCQPTSKTTTNEQIPTSQNTETGVKPKSCNE